MSALLQHGKNTMVIPALQFGLEDEVSSPCSMPGLWGCMRWLEGACLWAAQHQAVTVDHRTKTVTIQTVACNDSSNTKVKPPRVPGLVVGSSAYERYLPCLGDVPVSRCPRAAASGCMHVIAKRWL